MRSRQDAIKLPPIMQINPEPFVNGPPGFKSTLAAETGRAIVEELEKINQTIRQYNAAEQKSQKIRLLSLLNEQRAHLEERLPDSFITKFPALQEVMHRTLFNELKLHATQYLGIRSLHPDDFKAKIDEIAPPPLHPLIPVLANMAPDKVGRMMTILSQGAQYDINELCTLYQPDEPEYGKYIEFLQQHSIQFLGGVNSKNFLITPFPASTGERIVLRVEDFASRPIRIDREAKRSELSIHLSPIYIDRQETITINKDHKDIVATRNLVLTDYHSGGDLELLALSAQTPGERLKNAVDYYLQMAEILNQLENAGYAFSDSKNSNWLIKQGKLKISDCKSFLATYDGIIKLNYQRNQWMYMPISTPYITPPEILVQRNNYSADAIHAFIFGKNLYQYLTGSLGQLISGDKFSFDSPIFMTDAGKILKDVILNTVRGNPPERMSMRQVLVQLQEAKHVIEAEEKAVASAMQQHRIRTLQNTCSLGLTQLKAYNLQVKGDAEDGFTIDIERRLKDIVDINTLIDLSKEIYNKTIEVGRLDIIHKCDRLNQLIEGMGQELEIFVDDNLKIRLAELYAQQAPLTDLPSIKAVSQYLDSQHELIRKNIQHYNQMLIDQINKTIEKIPVATMPLSLFKAVGQMKKQMTETNTDDQLITMNQMMLKNIQELDKLNTKVTRSPKHKRDEDDTPEKSRLKH